MDYKRQAKFDFGLNHFYFRSGVISLNLPKNANFVDCHSLIQFPVLKQIVWNWYGSSETIKGRPGLISDFNIFSFWRIIPFLLKKKRRHNTQAKIFLLWFHVYAPDYFSWKKGAICILWTHFFSNLYQTIKSFTGIKLNRDPVAQDYFRFALSSWKYLDSSPGRCWNCEHFMCKVSCWTPRFFCWATKIVILWSPAGNFSKKVCFVPEINYSKSCLVWPSKGTVKWGHIRQVVA